MTKPSSNVEHDLAIIPVDTYGRTVCSGESDVRLLSGYELKGATSRYFELFLGRSKLSLIGKKPLNISFPG